MLGKLLKMVGVDMIQGLEYRYIMKKEYNMNSDCTVALDDGLINLRVDHYYEK